MNNLQEIKNQLLLRKQELEKTLALIYKEKVSDDQVQDTADQALTSSLEGVKLSLHDNELDEYQRIMRALDMIEKGTYGICSECDTKISERRLRLFPNATRCLVCQEVYEEGPSLHLHKQ